jgi:hypothetical protein
MYVYDHILLSSVWNEECFPTKVIDNIKTQILNSIFFLFENLPIYEIMWKTIVELDRPQIYHSACELNAVYLRVQKYDQ